MIFTFEQMQYLEQLEFTPEAILNLSKLNKEDLLRALKLQKNKVALTCHPDKTGDNKELNKKFLTLMEIYPKLVKSLNLQPDILSLITPIDYDIPLDCIDLRMEEQIDAHFETLLSQYRALSSDEERTEFVKKNETFLQFVNWLDKNRSKIHTARTEAFYQFTTAPSLFKKINYEWNTLVTQLFAEENLDDITYREAIALGLFHQILATRKLLSPIKWLCLIVCGLYNLLTTTASHLFNMLLLSINDDLVNISSFRVITLLMKITLMIGILSLPSLLLPSAVLRTIYSLPLISRTLLCLANPINYIIRPIAEYFNISESKVGFAALALTVAAASALTTLAVTTSLMTTLIVLANIAAILYFISLIAFLKKLYEILPGLSIALGVVMTCTTLITQLFVPQAPIETISEILVTLAAILSNLGINVLGYIVLTNLKEHTSKIYTTMPLPEEAAPDKVKEAMKEASLKNYWSHTLFNTSDQEKTNPAPKPEKSSHSMGFFGQMNKDNKSEDFLTLGQEPFTTCSP